MIIERFKTAAAREEDVDWIIEGMLTSGKYTFFVGDTGVGKSMLMIQLCDALQNGKEFLGRKVKQRNCLYVQVDTGMLEWRKQIKNITGYDSTAWTIYATVDNFLDNKEEVEKIRQIVWGDYPEGSPYYNVLYPLLKGQKFGLVVFDVLNAMTAKDLNSKEIASYVIDTLNSIAQRGEAEEREAIHYILVHHPSKSGAKKGTGAGAGSGAFSNLSGNMMTLYSSDEGLTGILAVHKTKVGPGCTLEIVRQPNGSWKLAEGNDSDYADMFKE